MPCYLSAAPESEQGGGDPDLLLQVGRCCKGMGNYERAIECLERANSESREDARILAELADCYSLVNESRAAKVFFREAFFRRPAGRRPCGPGVPARRSAWRRGCGRQGIRGSRCSAEWIPVYGAIWGVFSVKREMKPLEFGKLKQAIYQLEKECAEAGRGTGPARAAADQPLFLADRPLHDDRRAARADRRGPGEDPGASIPRVHEEYTS